MLDHAALTAKSPTDAARHEMHGSLILDLFGVVRFCSCDLARLMRCDPSDLTGRAVQNLLPDLAFSAKTPGYNLSLAKTMFAQGQWQPLRLTRDKSETLLIDAALESVEIQKRRLFHVDLRWPSRRSGDDLVEIETMPDDRPEPGLELEAGLAIPRSRHSE
jgi:hypothetical protein